MIRFRYLLWPAGLVFGVATEWIGRPDLIILDAPAGYALVFLGLAAWSRKPESRAGPIMGAAGFAWFLGTAWNPAVFLHRGPSRTSCSRIRAPSRLGYLLWPAGLASGLAAEWVGPLGPPRVDGTHRDAEGDPGQRDRCPASPLRLRLSYKAGRKPEAQHLGNSDEHTWAVWRERGHRVRLVRRGR
jgi:hypothetical protein